MCPERTINPQSLERIKDAANYMLRGSITSVNDGRITSANGNRKVHQRDHLLSLHPELHLRVDTSRLRSIIDFESFKCHPRSSVARDKAIKGSDIDVGVVVLREMVTIERQLAFINDLRDQGFDVFHQIEYEEITERQKRAESIEEKRSFSKAVSIRNYRRVHFYTTSELDEMSRDEVSTAVAAVYLVGTVIV